MATWAIGDIQGCLDELVELLGAINFNAAKDRLWLVGDLVNRGPQSLETLRFVRDLGDSAITVLGNHDFHLLAVADGVGRQHRKDTLQPVLDAPDCQELLEWLRFRPLAHYDPQLNFLMVHAGVAPSWTLEAVLRYAREVEATLRGTDPRAFYQAMYSDQGSCWSEELTGMQRLRVITDYLARVRFCLADGTYSVTDKGPPGSQPAGYIPWFELPDRVTADQQIIFGHWSSLGVVDQDNVFAMDSGCLWGRRLTAFCLDVPRWVSIECPQHAI